MKSLLRYRAALHLRFDLLNCPLLGEVDHRLVPERSGLPFALTDQVALAESCQPTNVTVHIDSTKQSFSRVGIPKILHDRMVSLRGGAA